MQRSRVTPLGRVSAALLGIGLVAAACGSDALLPTTTTTIPASTTTAATTTSTAPSSTTSTAPGEHPYGGEVVIGDLEPPVTLNHYAPGGESSIVSTIGQALWVGVADVDGFSLELVPDVVVELPSVANGGLVVNADGTESVEFVIDPAAVWADGTPISGEDFRFTYETVMDPGYGLDRSGYEDIVPGSVVVGEKSFRFTLSRPSLVVESLFGVVLPAHVVAGTDLMADWNDRMWVSGGPFQFESWTPGTEADPFPTITLTRNDAYWKVDGDTGQQLPFLDRVVFRFVGDVDTLVAEFEAKRLDVITPGADAAVLDHLATLEGAVVDVVGNGQWEHLSFQFGEGRLSRNPDSYNSHLEFRRAVAHAIDRQRIATELFGSWGVAMDSYIEAFTPAWSQDAWAQYDYDPDAARAALAELCAKDGIDCATNPPTVVFTAQSAELRIRLSEILEPMFTDVGIGYTVELDPALVFFGSTLDFGRYDLGGYSWKGSPGLAPLVRIHGAWDPGATPPLGLSFGRWGSREVTGQEEAGYNQGPSSVIDDNTRRYEILVSQMKFTADERELRAYFAEAEQILADQIVFIPLFQTPDAGVVWADEIAGYKHNISASGDLWNVAQWYRADA